MKRVFSFGDDMKNKFLNKGLLKKVTALSVSAAFLITSALSDLTYASLGTAMSSTISGASVSVPIIPSSLGKITSAKYFDSKDIIINIQDLHCHAETQRKIASIIGYIDNFYGLDKVYLEGAFKNVDTSWLSSFNDSKDGSNVLESLINNGKLSGTEYYSIVNNKKNFVSGIENEQLYKENIKLLGEIITLYPEIEAVCTELEKEIKKIKRDYSGRQARKLEKVVTSFRKKEITAKDFYKELAVFADSLGLSITKYPNVSAYIVLLEKAQVLDNKKVISEFGRFTSDLKNEIPYGEFSELLKKSNNFNNIEDIADDLINFNRRFSITKKLKLVNLETFFTYLEFNGNINPVSLIKEEEAFINELYTKMGRTKYEREVSFLSEFIPVIKKYFTADISADEYYNFEKDYNKFRIVWTSYFADNAVKNLDKYYKLLSDYHKNNIKRDGIFAASIISQNNVSTAVEIKDTVSAVEKIKSNISNKNIKLVVTGGFHTRGLEKIFEKQKISYAIITPKITEPIEQAKQIYIDNVMYYSKILRNTINLEPLTQEPLNVSFPKILNAVFTLVQSPSFENFSKEETIFEIKNFVRDYVITKQSDFYGNVEVLNWDIISYEDAGKKIEFFVRYKDNGNKAAVNEINYVYSDGQITDYASIDDVKTLSMVKRIKNSKYAKPSIELEPSGSARGKIAEHVLKPLSEVSDKFLSLMPFEQLHMTIGYDSSDFSDSQMDEAVESGDKKGDIFVETKLLGESFTDVKTTLRGTLKLMPDGVIIYEITDENLIAQMMGLRAKLINKDSKYKTPSIVHMTIGRIFDETLFDGSAQSRQELSDLLQKLNEKIYEINNKNALSKIKTSFTVKGGYVSSTGDKDFLIERYSPEKSQLIIFKSLFSNARKNFKLIYDIVAAPAVEETVFRFAPFFLTTLAVANPASIVPVIVTSVVGVLGFSIAHSLADKITKQTDVRNWKSFVIPSVILTGTYLAVSLAFPQFSLLAPVVTTVLHSLNNVFSLLTKDGKFNLLNIIKADRTKSDGRYFEDSLKELLVALNSVIEKLPQKKADELKNIYNDLRIAEGLSDKKIAATAVKEISDFLKTEAEKNKKSSYGEDGKYYFEENVLLEQLLNISAVLNDEDGTVLFDEMFNFVMHQATDKKNFSTRFQDYLLSSARYLYNNGKKEYFHKILNALYNNKSLVKNITEYGRFALPLPSPMSFESVEKWEESLNQSISADKDIYSNWYLSQVDLFLSLNDDQGYEYAKALIRVLYKTGKQTTPPYLKARRQGYEWTKEFYEICGVENDVFISAESPVLLEAEDVKDFVQDVSILEKYNLYLSDVISRLQYSAAQVPSNAYFQSEEFSDVISQLKKALSLSKRQQLQTVTQQLNRLIASAGSNGTVFNEKVFETLIPVIAFVKSSDTGKSLLNSVIDYFKISVKDLSAVARIYEINKEDALSLFRFIYNYDTGVKINISKPQNLKEAYDQIPSELKSLITEYEDLEKFYKNIDIEFDSIEKESSVYDRTVFIPEYELIFDKLPSSFFETEDVRPVKYFRTLKKRFQPQTTVNPEFDVLHVSSYFDALDNVLENNVFALSEMNKGNKESMMDALYFTGEMIKNLAVFDDRHAMMLDASFERIKSGFEKDKISVAEMAKLKPWTGDSLDSIEQLHTLINAVHQSSIEYFMSALKDNVAGTKYTLKENDKEYFSFYDCSQKGVSRRMQEFLSNLTIDGIKGSTVNMVSKDNKLICSKKLGIHSVDILVDLDEGIRVNFNDSGRGDGNAMRTVLLASLFSQAGFDITDIDSNVSEDRSVTGVCKFSAHYSVPENLSSAQQYSYLFAQALNIVSNTVNLDFDIEGNDVDTGKHYYNKFDVPHLTVDEFQKMKSSSVMPRGFDKISYLKQQWQARVQSLKNSVEKMQHKQNDFSDVYKMLRINSENATVWTIVQKYVEGKLDIKDGRLQINENYDATSDLLDAINLNVDETLRQAQIINLLNYGDFNFETEAYIGGMIVLSGALRLDDKGWISVKLAVDKERKRAKCAVTEFVDFDGNRTKLTYEKLIDKLNAAGYKVKKQKPRSVSEKENTLKVLRERILPSKDGIYMRGMGVSAMNEGYVPVRITYDKEKVDENGMWVASYVSPEDVATIIRAKALMTTNGGTLSHANITARENNKTAILSNGVWRNGKLEVPYYIMESEIHEHGAYQVQKISEHKITLKEGDVVLANGDNGRILLYNEISEQEINFIVHAIENNDSDKIVSYIKEHETSANIRQIVEYIFLQVVDDKTKSAITDALLEWKKDTEIGKKVSELNGVYASEKIKAVKEVLENIKSVEDENIKYSILTKLETEIQTVKYSAEQEKELKELLLLTETINKEKQKVMSQVRKDLKVLKARVLQLLSKESLTSEEIDELLKINEKAKVWNFYASSSVKELSGKMDEILSVQDIVSGYDTEIKGFEQISARDNLKYGTKTTELAKMAKLFAEQKVQDTEIPHGIGISKNVLKIFFENTSSSQKFSQLVEDFESAIKTSDKQKAFDAGRQITKLIDELNDKSLEEFLFSKLRQDKKYAVRSSGVGEDGIAHAFAGMAKTELNVDKNGVYESVKNCWKSFYAQSCIEDMIKEGIVVEPALLVQEMVSGVKKAGVIFSRDNDGNLTLETVLGLGEGLVSGRITPDHISVRSSDGRIDYRRALNNMTKIEERDGGGTVMSKLTEEEKMERVVDEATINKLKYIAYLLETDAQYPVDIEFAIDENGKIYVLQRRPITTLTNYQFSDDGVDYEDVTEIEQSIIDNLIENLKAITKYGDFTDTITQVRQTLENLPENSAEKYKIISDQINVLFKIIMASKNKKYKDSLFDYILPFAGYVNDQSTGKLLFDSILPLLFENMEDDKKYEVISAAGDMMKVLFAQDKTFAVKIVESLLEKGVIEKEEEIPFSIMSGLRDYGYSGLETYYLTVSEGLETDKSFSGVLKQSCRNMFNVVSNEQTLKNKENITKILYELDVLAQKINKVTIPLLQYQLNMLFEEIVKTVKEEDNKSFADKMSNEIFDIIRKIVSETESLDYKKISGSISFLLNAFYNVNSDNKEFYNLFSNVVSVAKMTDGIAKNETNAKTVELLVASILEIYSPISDGKLEEGSQEYETRKRHSLDLFKMLAESAPNNVEIYRALFNFKDDMIVRRKKGIGFNPETLGIFLSAAKNNDKKTKLYFVFPQEDYISQDTGKMVDMLSNAHEYVDLAYTIINAYRPNYSYSFRRVDNVKAKEMAQTLIEKLFDIANDKNNDLQKRKDAAYSLIRITAAGIYKTKNKEISVDLSDVRKLVSELDMPVYLYQGEVYMQNINGEQEYRFTPLLSSVEQTVVEKYPLELFGGYGRKRDDEAPFMMRNPTVTEINGRTDFSKAEVGQVLLRFQLLQEILDYNVSVLTMLNKIKDPVNYEKNVSELLNNLQQMIERLAQINSEHGQDAQTALNAIKASLNDKTVDERTKIRKHLSLDDWKIDTIRDITGIHTLINAVHQVSIADFKQEIGDVRKIGTDMIQTVNAEGLSSITAYNLSDKVNSNIVKFITRLSSKNFSKVSHGNKIDDFICKDDMVVWTTRLNAHSVDIFFNFGDIDRGISVYYRERPVNYADVGKKERIRYFATILESLGFNVTLDTQYSDGQESYGLQAVFNKDYGLNDSSDIIDIAEKVVELFKFSTNLDYDLKYRHDEMQYEDIFERVVDKFQRGEMWYGVDINNYGWKAFGYGEGGINLVSLPNKRSLNADSLNAILTYLGITDLLPEDTTARDLTDQRVVDRYFNEPMERAFIEGNLVIDEQGVLKKNEGYDLLKSIIEDVFKDVTETSKQGRIINLVNGYDLKTKIVGYVGDLVAVSSVMELVNGNKLFIKGVMSPQTKRFRYAAAELIVDGQRQKIGGDKLIEILTAQGYEIESQEWVSKKERKRIKNLLERSIQSVESPQVRCSPTSEGKGVYVAGNITFDKQTVDQNSILVVPYTTPDDIKAIQTAKGIITTGGGVLSHAAITTRELEKPSVVLSAANWVNGETEIQYYLSENGIVTVNGFQTQKVKAKNLSLKNGYRVLINGEKGTVLLFNDMDTALLDRLQSYIDGDDAVSVADFMKERSEDENLNRFVEYVYFQVVDNPQAAKILDGLFSKDMPVSVKNKIKKLNEGYIQDKIQSLYEALDNVKNVTNVNIAYSIIEQLTKKLEFIKTVEPVDEIEDIKKQVAYLQKEIKDKLNVYLQNFIDESYKLLNKGKLSGKDMQKITKMSDNVSVYKFFVSETDTDERLQEQRRIIQILAPMLNDLLSKNMNKGDITYIEKEIISFDGINDEDGKNFGSKTTELAKMYRLLKGKKDVTVPNGVGISVNILELIFDSIGCKPLLDNFERAIQNGDFEEAIYLSEQIISVIELEDERKFAVEEQIRYEISKYTDFNTKYSVRSSGVGEDGATNAFAGMGETKLNVNYDEVYESLKECWKSFFSERCIKYMIQSGQVVKPAVLIQEMVESEKAGVIFSRDKYGNEIINVLFGLGEGLVSGMLTPDNIQADINTGETIEYSVADKPLKIIADYNGGTQIVSVGKKSKSRTLNSQMIKRITEIVRLLEEDAGYPVDVEFAVKGEEIFILQRRAITTLDKKINVDEIQQTVKKKDVQTKYNVALVSGQVGADMKEFVCLSNPLSPEEAIPVYLKAVGGDVTEFLVDSKYAGLVSNGILGAILVDRINTDTVVLDRLNGSLFSYKEGEIGLLPVLDDVLEKGVFDENVNIKLENVRSLLASA